MNLNGILVAALALAVAAPGAAMAQDWPTKPVLVVGSGAPGGPVEAALRGVTEPLSETLGRQFVIESKPGAGGHIANEFVSRAAPDGYTFGNTTIAAHGIGPALYRTLNYDPEAFTFIARLVGFPNVVYVAKDSPYRTLADLVAAAKADPGAISQGSIGVGTSTQMIGVFLMEEAGIELTHVPYKGSAPLMNGVLSGEIGVAVDNLPGALGQIKGGEVRALAVTTATRSPQLPDVPTVAEQGYPGFDVASWYGLVGPKGIPEPIVARLSEELRAILASERAREYYARLGADIIYLPPDEFATFVRSERARWEPIVKASGATVD